MTTLLPLVAPEVVFKAIGAANNDDKAGIMTAPILQYLLSRYIGRIP